MGTLYCICCISVICPPSVCFGVLYAPCKPRILCFKFSVIFPSAVDTSAAQFVCTSGIGVEPQFGSFILNRYPYLLVC